MAPQKNLCAHVSSAKQRRSFCFNSFLTDGLGSSSSDSTISVTSLLFFRTFNDRYTETKQKTIAKIAEIRAKELAFIKFSAAIIPINIVKAKFKIDLSRARSLSKPACLIEDLILDSCIIFSFLYQYISIWSSIIIGNQVF